MASIEWECSPTDVPGGGTLRYVPILFVGGYLGTAVAVGVASLPLLVSNPRLLGLLALFVLVGGPFSLLYLWPMLRDPDQRPAPESVGWLFELDPIRALAAAVLGTVLILGGGAVAGSRIVYAVLVFCLAVSLPLIGLFDAEGRVDPDAGTLTFGEHTAAVEALAAVDTYRVGSLVICRLSYVEGAGGFGRPHLIAIPEAVSEGVLPVLEGGVAADSPVEPREPDRIARAVLVGVTLFFLGTAGAAVVLLDEAAVLLALVAGGLGLVFALGARYAA